MPGCLLNCMQRPCCHRANRPGQQRLVSLPVPFHRLAGLRMDSHRSGFAVRLSFAGTGPDSRTGGLPVSFIRLSSAADLTGIGQERKMCRPRPGNAGRKKAGRASPAKFRWNKPHVREKRRPPCQLGSFCRSQAAVAAVTVGSMNIKGSVHAAVQKLAVARRQNLARGSSTWPYRPGKWPGAQARPSVGNQAAVAR